MEIQGEGYMLMFNHSN